MCSLGSTATFMFLAESMAEFVGTRRVYSPGPWSAWATSEFWMSATNWSKLSLPLLISSRVITSTSCTAGPVSCVSFVKMSPGPSASQEKATTSSLMSMEPPACMRSELPWAGRYATGSPAKPPRPACGTTGAPANLLPWPGPSTSSRKSTTTARPAPTNPASAPKPKARRGDPDATSRAWLGRSSTLRGCTAGIMMVVTEGPPPACCAKPIGCFEPK
mmetsp:Transcript_117175/g.332039  ORF Transcript_117175/g.332039 Transcript_117175/m.332039 type:complete len:218 (-) Transcript_117175:12-665(-)